ncbi:hypothetical protein BGZ94_002033 [Podila epigama]|nr:hypothetical protein BGZ94_002033 [Podila epigama]
MSFLRKNPPVRPHHQVQARPLHANSSNGPAIKRKIEKPVPQPAPGTYTDYKLVSTSHDLLHHVMRFHGNKDVNPATFAPPVKLHRKRNENQYYRNYNYYNKYANKAGQGATGTAAAGDAQKGGAPGATPAAGAPAPTTGADTSLIAPYGGGVRNKQMLFKKKTRQIYIANEDERKKKEIESAPWVIEDEDGTNNFTGQLEGGQHANYVLFVFSDDGFKVVPADKWYKFSPKLQYATLTAEEAEEQYQKYAKQHNSNRWLMRSKNKAKTEDGEEGVEEDADGDHFMTVDHDDEAGYDEDEAKERKRRRGKHGDVDEMDFDEVWQDDEEAPSEMPGFDDEDKDDPRKKIGASMDSDDDEDDEDGNKLTDTGREIKKALLKLEKNKVYADDDDKDPYASDKDSSDSDLDEVDKEKEVKKEEEAANLAQEQAKAKKKTASSAKGSPLIPKKASATKTPTKPVSAKVLKGVKVPMPAPRNASGSGTGTTSNAATPRVPKATASSPNHAPSASPPASANVSDKKKRKLAEGDEGTEDGPSNKKKMNMAEEHAGASTATSSSASGVSPTGAGASGSSPAPNDDSLLITEAEVVALLKSRPQVTTRDLIMDLKRKLRKESRNRTILATIVKKVASSQDGVLTLKDGY